MNPDSESGRAPALRRTHLREPPTLARLPIRIRL